MDTTESGSLLSNAGYTGNYNGGNSLFMSCGSIYTGPVAIMEFNYLGKLLIAWYAPYGVHHDICLVGEHMWVTGSNLTGPRETIVYSVDRETGEIGNVLDYTDVLQV